MKIRKLLSGSISKIGAAAMLLAIAAVGCTKKSVPEKTPTPTETAQPKPPVAPAEMGKHLVASLKKTPCYGTCPVFEFELQSNGEATFYGIKNVARIGKFRAAAPRNWQRDLEKAADEAGVFSLSEKYPTSGRHIADFPTTTTILNFGEKKQRIENNFDAPLALQKFEQYFFEKIEELNWVKIN